MWEKIMKHGLAKIQKRKVTSKFQTNCKLAESSSENPTTIPPVLVFLSKIAPNTTTTYIEPLVLWYESVDRLWLGLGLAGHR